jgi:hypothetical protein
MGRNPFKQIVVERKYKPTHEIAQAFHPDKIPRVVAE